jgi:hypothetical protein
MHGGSEMESEKLSEWDYLDYFLAFTLLFGFAILFFPLIALGLIREKLKAAINSLKSIILMRWNPKNKLNN